MRFASVPNLACCRLIAQLGMHLHGGHGSGSYSSRLSRGDPVGDITPVWRGGDGETTRRGEREGLSLMHQTARLSVLVAPIIVRIVSIRSKGQMSVCICMSVPRRWLLLRTTAACRPLWSRQVAGSGVLTGHLYATGPTTTERSMDLTSICIDRWVSRIGWGLFYNCLTALPPWHPKMVCGIDFNPLQTRVPLPCCPTVWSTLLFDKSVAEYMTPVKGGWWCSTATWLAFCCVFGLHAADTLASSQVITAHARHSISRKCDVVCLFQVFLKMIRGWSLINLT